MKPHRSEKAGTSRRVGTARGAVPGRVQRPERSWNRLPKAHPSPVAPLARRGRPSGPSLPELTPEQITENFLERIAQGAELCRKIESQLRQHPAPELETIIKWYRLLALRLSAEVQAVPELRHLLSALMRPVMEWARLEEKRKDRDSAEQRHRDETAARNGARSGQADRDRALQPETLERIERELTLF